MKPFDMKLDYTVQEVFPDESFLYNSKHLGETFYKVDSRWNALVEKPIRELTDEELKFGCSAVSTNGLAIYKLETKRRELLKLVKNLQESLNHGHMSNNEMDFIKKGILDGFDSIYQSEESRDKKSNEIANNIANAMLREMKL